MCFLTPTWGDDPIWLICFRGLKKLLDEHGVNMSEGVLTTYLTSRAWESKKVRGWNVWRPRKAAISEQVNQWRVLVYIAKGWNPLLFRGWEIPLPEEGAAQAHCSRLQDAAAAESCFGAIWRNVLAAGWWCFTLATQFSEGGWVWRDRPCLCCGFTIWLIFSEWVETTN